MIWHSLDGVAKLSDQKVSTVDKFDRGDSLCWGSAIIN